MAVTDTRYYRQEFLDPERKLKKSLEVTTHGTFGATWDTFEAGKPLVCQQFLPKWLAFEVSVTQVKDHLDYTGCVRKIFTKYIRQI